MRMVLVFVATLIAGPLAAQTYPPAPPTAEDADMAVFIDILRANGCSQPVMDLINADPNDALTLDRARALGPMVTLHINAGNLAVNADGNVLSVPDAVCSGGPLAATARDNLRAMLYANACVLPLADAQAQMTALGHDSDQTAFALNAMQQFREVAERIGVAMTVDGVTTPAEPTALVLKDPACPAEPEESELDPAEVRSRLIQMLADSECDMTIGEAQGVIADYGLEIGQIVRAVGPMIDAGEATQLDGLLTLAPDVCASADG